VSLQISNLGMDWPRLVCEVGVVSSRLLQCNNVNKSHVSISIFIISVTYKGYTFKEQ